jgi:hypothetical protein
MLARRIVWSLSFVAAITLGLAAVQADMVWDGIAEGHNGTTQGQTTPSTDRWQYMEVTEGTNTGYSFLPWDTTESTWFDPTDNAYVYKTTGAMGCAPGKNTKAGVIAWLSPITGTVDLSFKLTDTHSADGGDESYAVFKSGGVTPLISGEFSHGGTTGTLSVSGVSVATGDLLYFQVGPSGSYSGDWSQFDMLTISSIPEPSALCLLGYSAISLLAYAWRKRG